MSANNRIDMKNTENQEFENSTLEDGGQEPVIDTDDLAEEVESQTANDAAVWQEKYIRLSAEFDNYRKRTLKEKMELIQSGGADVLKAILATADDFERALTHMSESPDKEGVQLIFQKFIDTLRTKGVTEIEALGKPLDVDFHEAIANVPTTDEAHKGAIIDVIQKGYMHKDKVLRFAKVVVGE